MDIRNITTGFIMMLHKPRISRKILFLAEISIFIATCFTLAAILKLHPVPFTLFLLIAQPLFLVGIALYLVVTIVSFISRHGTSKVNYAPGEIVFRTGDKGDFVYTIIHGNVEIIKEDAYEGEKVLAVLGPGDYFGEMALMTDKPRNATARAVNSVEVMTIAKDDFQKLHDYIPALKNNIDKVIQSRMPVSKTKDIGTTG
ncbi:MAG: cyclic nucleotide-binding domain-containing protein [Thermodesulfobacteriota bacterium]